MHEGMALRATTPDEIAPDRTTSDDPGLAPVAPIRSRPVRPRPARPVSARPGQVRERQTIAAVETLFAVRPTPRDELPDPRQVARDLARCVVEVLAGARELEQIGRWLSDDVHRNLQTRVSLAARARSVRRQAPHRPVFRIGSVLVDEPASGVAEATVIVHARARTRAVAIRLEGLDGRWRATAISVL